MINPQEMRTITAKTEVTVCNSGAVVKCCLVETMRAEARSHSMKATCTMATIATAFAVILLLHLHECHGECALSKLEADLLCP